MRRLIDIIRFTIISPEFAILAVSLIVSKFYPTVFTFWGEIFRSSSNEIVRYIALIPIGVLTVAIKSSWEILFPDKDLNKILHEWADYQRLKDRVIASLAICLLCSISSCTAWVIYEKVTDYILGAIIILSISISLVVVICLFLAKVKVREIIE